MIVWKLVNLEGRYIEKTGERLTQDQLAELTGLSRPTISSIELGKPTRLDFPSANKILNFFSQALGETLTMNDLLEFTMDDDPDGDC